MTKKSSKSKRMRKSRGIDKSKLLNLNKRNSRSTSAKVKYNKDKGIIEVEKPQNSQLLLVDEENPIIEETRESLSDKYTEIQKMRNKQNW